MKILFIVTAHNSLSQRAFVELSELGHEVTIQFASSQDEMIATVDEYAPDLIIAPFLKEYIPDIIWHNHICLIVHPGIKGDRGPSSLDWAILNDTNYWGVTILEASEEMDAGKIWSSNNFPMRTATKSSIYRHEVTQAAITGLLDAVDKFQQHGYIPESLDYGRPDVKGSLLPAMKQADRCIDWTASTEEIARKIRAADSQPGVLDTIFGQSYYLYGVHEEDVLKGSPGDIIAKRNGAICRCTGNGAVWITHLKKKANGSELYCKLPAEQVLEKHLNSVPVNCLSPFEEYPGKTFRDIYYVEKDNIGYLHFPFYNGAMSTEQCERLTKAYIIACSKDTKVLVLMGGDDFWSNGINLNTIEAAPYPGNESWKNINAINDFVHQVITTNSKLIISVFQGNAAAGGVILALAADFVFARDGVVLNPHYKNMGLYGSEYWTYLLPKKIGNDLSNQLTEECKPISTNTALSIGLIDFSFSAQTLHDDVHSYATTLAVHPDYDKLLIDKKELRFSDEQRKPLADYRKEELSEMRTNFFGENSMYHALRKSFVYKLSCVNNSAQLAASR